MFCCQNSDHFTSILIGQFKQDVGGDEGTSTHLVLVKQQVLNRGMTVQIKDALIWEKAPNWYTTRRATSLQTIQTIIKKCNTNRMLSKPSYKQQNTSCTSLTQFKDFKGVFIPANFHLHQWQHNWPMSFEMPCSSLDVQPEYTFHFCNLQYARRA
jgi:hypothetical protein